MADKGEKALGRREKEGGASPEAGLGSSGGKKKKGPRPGRILLGEKKSREDPFLEWTSPLSSERGGLLPSSLEGLQGGGSLLGNSCFLLFL